MHNKEHEAIGGIIQEDIERIRRKTKIGDKIRVQTLKAVDVEAPGTEWGSLKGGTVRRGTVVQKFPHFAVVEFDGGVRDSVLWADLVKRHKGAC